MISKPDFIQHILEGSRASAKLAPKKTKAKATQAPPEEADALAGFGFDDEPADSAESVSPPAVETSFARTLLEKSLSASGQAIGTDDVILGGDPARKFLPAKLYYWPKADNRPFQTLLFELTMPSSELLKEPLFRPAKGVTEDALTRLVADTLRGFEQGGEARSADTKQGKQTETLCVVSIRDDRSKEYDSAHLVCLGTVSKSEGSLETFHIREEARFWEPQLAADHLERLYDRHFKKLDSEKWQDAFITGEERKLARKLMDVCQDKKRTEGKIQGAVVDLLEQIALSYGLRKHPKSKRRLEATDLPEDHDIGVTAAVVAEEKKNPFKGMSLRDEKNRLLGYIIYCLDEKEDADELRKHLKANNRFHNVLVVYPNGESTGLELWQGQKPLEGKLTKRGATFEGEGQVVNLLSRFFVVSKALVSNPVQLAEELAYRARYLRGFAVRELEKPEAVRDEDLAKLYQAFHDVFLKSEEEDEAKQHDEFADSYAQTLTYGLLSARWIGKEELNESGERFTLENATGLLERTSPFFKDLFSQVISRSHDASRDWLLQDITDLLDRIDIDAVFTGVEDDVLLGHDPVMHFYEPFLEAYDSAIKRQRGVFYTPHPVVSYIVRSVHEMLQTEFGLADGLADTTTWGEMVERNADLKLPPKTHEEGETDTISPDEPFVQILDPATGTATFLVEVIDVIYQTLVAKWEKGGKSETEIEKAWNAYVPGHLLPRLYGYELMMAPYAIAHLKIGLKLAETGYGFAAKERARVYLTNALGAADHGNQFSFALPALANEAIAVNRLKQHKRFSIIVGNPPYSRHSSNPSKDANGDFTFIGKLIEDYKAGCPELRQPAQGKYLQDDYVKFLRFAEHLISQSGVGVLGFITNHGFLDNPTFRGIRKHCLSNFSTLSILDLHGNTNKKERCPDGSEDENVFDIKQGVTILIGGKSSSGNTDIECSVHHGDLWGKRDRKYRALTSGTSRELSETNITPKDPGFFLCERDETNEEEYLSFFSVKEIFSPNGRPAPGIVTTHDSFAIAFTENEIIENVETLLSSVDEDDARTHFRLCSQDQWNYDIAKRQLSDQKWRKLVIPVYYRPFDIRYSVYDSNVAVHRRARVTEHLLSGENIALLTSRMTKGESFHHAQVTRVVPEVICMSPKTSNNGFVFPLWLYDDLGSEKLLESERTLNLSREFIAAITATFGSTEKGEFGIPKGLGPIDLFSYIYAILHSPNYRSRYEVFLKGDFPRIPIIKNPEAFERIAEVGQTLIDRHMLEDQTSRSFESVFVGGQSTTVGRVGWSDNTVWINSGHNIPNREDTGNISDSPGDIGFTNVSEEVWRFQIGGYQVCHKWLKDRKGRPLTDDDILHYRKIVTAISETIRLMAEIDEVIEAHGGWPDAFQTESDSKEADS